MGQIMEREIRGSHSDAQEDSSYLGCYCCVYW